MTHADQHKESHERNETENAEDNRRPSKDDVRLEHQEAANDAPPDFAICSKMLWNRRDSRVFGLVLMA